MNAPAGADSQIHVEGAADDAQGALRTAIGRAAIPSLAGIFYETMGLAWVLGGIAALTALSLADGDTAVVSRTIGSDLAEPGSAAAIAALLLSIPLILVAARVSAGLARIVAPGAPDGRKPTLRNSWRSGVSVQVSAVGVWLQIFGMMASGTLILLGPLVLLALSVGGDTLGPFGVVLSGLALTLTLVYGAELGALQELALASLVRHRRGVGSAVLHGWRMMRAHPGPSRRIATIEFVARFVTVAAVVAVTRRAGLGAGVATFCALGAITGSVRAHLWANAYPRLGGLDPGYALKKAAEAPK
ncbi:MAG: hypothetical protein AAF726_12805 [Planctomycetota bacterium]